MLRRAPCNRAALSAATALVAAQRCASVPEYNFGQPTLATPFPSSIASRSLPAVSAAPKISKQPNGLRVVTQDFEGCQTSVGMYALAGARYDPLYAIGLNHMLRLGFTMSNMNSSLFQIDRNLRANGVSQELVELRKKYIGVRVTARNDSWKASVDDIFAGFAIPRFDESDLERFRDTYDNLYDEQRWQRPRDFVKDRVESVAFFREPLGGSRTVVPNCNDPISTDKLIAQYAKYIVPSRMTLVGVNIPHNELLATYENCAFPHSETAPHHARTVGERKDYNELHEDLQYTGGEYFEQELRAKEMGTKPNMEEDTAIAVAFLATGRDKTVAEFAAGLVAKQLLDITISDNLRYNREGNAYGVRSFYSPFSSTGLLGFTIVAAPEASVKLTTDAVSVFRTLKPNADELVGAKVRAAVAFNFEELDTTRDYCDFLVNATNGNGIQSAASYIEAINAVTLADVTKVLEKGRAALPSMYVTGETLAFPTLRQLGMTKAK